MLTPQRMHCCSAPPGDGPFRLALIAHASTQNVLHARKYRSLIRALAAWLVAAVCGAGAGAPGPWRHRRKISRDQAAATNQLSRSGYATRLDQSALSYLREQLSSGRTAPVIVGHSAGAGAAGAGRRNPQGVARS